MIARSLIVHAVPGILACLPGMAAADVYQVPVAAFGPEDEVHLSKSRRVELETTACRGRPTERREYLVTWRESPESLLAFVRCHEPRDSDGQIPVDVIRCRAPDAKAAWQCEQHNSNYRIDFGKRFILAANPQMTIDVAGEPPDKSSDALAAILASEPRRLDGKECEMPRYVEGAFEVACEGVQYVVKRTCDDKGCRRTVRRK